MYRRAASVCARLRAAGLYVIIDLTGTPPAASLDSVSSAMPMPTFPCFLALVAAAFAGTISPLRSLQRAHDISWTCWRDGCRTPEGGGPPGCRSRERRPIDGRKQPILLGGMNWANDLSGWLQWRPRDPAWQLVASVHVYDGNACGDERCWNSIIGKVARQVPVVTGEIGEEDCAHRFIDSYMSWADAHGVSYIAWAWAAALGLREARPDRRLRRNPDPIRRGVP